MKFHENPSSGAKLFHTDGYDEANSRLSKLCDRA